MYLKPIHTSWSGYHDTLGYQLIFERCIYGAPLPYKRVQVITLLLTTDEPVTLIRHKMLKAMIICTAVLVIYAAVSVRAECSKPTSQPNTTIADMVGLPYMKFYKRFFNGEKTDGIVLNITKVEGEDNKYNVEVTMVYEDGDVKKYNSTWTEFPSEQKFQTKKGNEPVYYSIPYLEKNYAAILFICDDTTSEVLDNVTMVFTRDLDNDLTKAVEEAKKITNSELDEHPFKKRDLFPSSSKPRVAT